MNGHPIARTKMILRQCEAPVKIYNSRWFPASNYSVKWSIMAGQSSTIKKMVNFLALFFDFISIQVVQGAIWEGPELIPEVKNTKQIIFF